MSDTARKVPMFQSQQFANLHELAPNLLPAKYLTTVYLNLIPRVRAGHKARWTTGLKASFLAALVCFIISPAKADSAGGCRAMPIKAYEFHAAAEMGQKIRRYVEQSNSKIAIVGRVGSDISNRGLKYTHAGILWRDHPRGRWSFVHELNTCGKEYSRIYDQGLVNFFLDDPFKYDTWVMLPKPWLQDAVDAALKSGVGNHLHWSRYSMISHPRSTRYQNSNEWLLEVFTYAEMVNSRGGMPTRHEIQRFHDERGFRGSLIKVGQFEKLFGSLFANNVGFSDHPETSRRSGRYEFVSVRSLFRYFNRRGFLHASREFYGPQVIPRRAAGSSARLQGDQGR